MLATTFISRGTETLLKPTSAADTARPTLEGLSKLPDPVGSAVPTDAEAFTRVTAGVQVGAGLLLASGRLPRLSAAALAASVLPGNLIAHPFWQETDPALKAAERRAFVADISLLGGLVIASIDTEGKPSLGWRGRRAARKLGQKVTAALPTTEASTSLLDNDLVDKLGEGLQTGLAQGADRGRELAHLLRERGSEWVELAVDRGSDLADEARVTAPKLARKARKELKRLHSDLEKQLG